MEIKSTTKCILPAGLKVKSVGNVIGGITFCQQLREMKLKTVTMMKNNLNVALQKTKREYLER